MEELTSSTESLPSTTENQYLEMANHAKELVDMKDKIIRIHKDRLDEIDEELRKIGYIVSQMGYLVEYKMKQNETKKDLTFFNMTDKALKGIKTIVENTRNMTEIDEIDQEVALQFISEV